MTPLEFDFNEPNAALEQLMQKEPFCAAQFLTLMEGEDEEVFEEALQMLNDRHILPELADLPVPACDGEAGLRLRQEQQLVQEGKLLTGLSENDPLRLYLEELAAVPACGDVQLLAERLVSGDRTVTQQLTNLLLSRVVERACELTGRGVLLLDLIQEGSIGLKIFRSFPIHTKIESLGLQWNHLELKKNTLKYIQMFILEPLM